MPKFSTYLDCPPNIFQFRGDRAHVDFVGSSLIDIAISGQIVMDDVTVSFRLPDLGVDQVRDLYLFLENWLDAYEAQEESK